MPTEKTFHAACHACSDGGPGTSCGTYSPACVRCMTVSFNCRARRPPCGLHTAKSTTGAAPDASL
eukprot:3068254-Heterocapsa_arctica.AAC.1